MTKLERLEILSIVMLTVAAWLIASHGNTSAQFGTVLMWSAALLLFQSLVRDLGLLLNAKKSVVHNEARTERCICVESVVGGVGIIIGALLLVFGVGWAVQVTAVVSVTSVLLVLTFGFLAKDYVIAWRPWRLYRDKDHLNIIVKWW